MAYQRPMVTVDQNMTTTPTSIERDQPAFIFGPNYLLHRYSDADEKQKTMIGTYDGATMIESYPGAVDGAKVDETHGYTKLTGDDVVVKLCTLAAASLPEVNVPAGYLTAKGGYTKILFAGKAYVDFDINGSHVNRDAATDGVLNRNIVVGDAMWIEYQNNGTTFKMLTRVDAIDYRASAWDLDSSSESSEGPAGTLITLYDAIPVGSTVSRVCLADVLQNVVFDKKNTVDQPINIWAWEEGEFEKDGKSIYGVRVNGGCLFAEDTAYFGNFTQTEVLSANLYVTFREILTGYADAFHSVTGASEVANILGTIDPGNPLAYGVYMAALNAATDDGDEAPPIYFMGVKTDDLEGYSDVLNKATLTDRAYVFAATTQDDDVLELLRSHVLSMSTKSAKMWRIAAASAEIPEFKEVVGNDIFGHPYFAIPLTDSGASPSQVGTAKWNKLMIVSSLSDISGNDGIDLRSTHELTEGDTIKILLRTNDRWGDQDWRSYTVRKVISRNTVEVKEEISVATEFVADTNSYIPQVVRAYHRYSNMEYAEKVASVSRSFATRRMVNVWPPQFVDNGQEAPGSFAACAVAGLISATEPQQPITNMSIRGIDNVPLCQLYNNSELDTMASGGTFIVAQDLPDDIVYVRHQITTAYPDGNLNTAELSITKNVDSISYAFADVFRPYYGKYNITPELIAILENLAGQLISQFAGSLSVYGPQLIADQTAIKYVRQNELMKDHVDIAITLGVPYPCNNIDIVLTV